jgi:hypothetical protein
MNDQIRRNQRTAVIGGFNEAEAAMFSPGPRFFAVLSSKTIAPAATARAKKSGLSAYVN